jgi:hypothetical protein
VPAVQRYVTLVVGMSGDALTLWCPYSSGQSDVLPSAARAWWDTWLAIGVVLYRPTKRVAAH